MRRVYETFGLDFFRPEELTLKGHALTLSFMLGDTELKSITAYRDYKRIVNGSDLDGGAFSFPLFHTTNEEAQDQFSQEFQLIGDLSEQSVQYVLGLYYFKEDSDSINPQILTPVVGTLPTGEPIIFPVNAVLSYTTDNKSQAAYGQLSYTPKWLDRLTVTLGARYTEDEKEANLRSAGFKGDESWSDFSPSITVEYMPSDSLNLYGTVSSGYNSGVFNVRAATQAAFGTPADAEEVINYEVGIKSQFWDNRLRFNAAAFWVDYTELQVSQFQASASGATSVLTNAGEAEIRGIEFELSLIPLPGLLLDLSYGYTDFEYKEFITSINQVTGVAVDDADSADPPGPENTASLSVEYEFGHWDFGWLRGRLGLTYADEISANPFASKVASKKEHTLLDARLTMSEIPFGAGNVRISIWGKNLTDEEYILRGIDFGLASGLGFAGATYSDPRTYGVDFTYEH
ncbi:MAG: TonB-dependent receptor [Halioglobus sp.]|nr:TonB-dependent receptor [Halioglobus sp.]